jgi:hypothetical protein
MTKRQIQKHNWYLKNKERLIKIHKNYYESHKEQILKNCKEYVNKYKEKTIIYQKEYREKNKKKLQKQHDIKRKIRLKTDLNYRIKYNLRVRLYKALHRKQKVKTTIELLGCSIEFLRGWIAQQFQVGMNWNNYGKWEIDHIKPCSSFDLSKPSEQKECFHYTNLQPLWESDNIKKHTKIKDII